MFTIFLLNCMYNVWIFYPPYMQFKRQVTYYITKIAPHLLTKWVYHFSFSRACFLWTLPVWQLNWPKKKPDQLAHVTVVDRVIYIGLMVSCLLSGIIWQSDKQTDRQTDKQSVGFWQRSHCQSHCHSVPLSSPTATGQYLSRQSASLPNIEQHAVAVFFFPRDFWTHCLCLLLLLLLLLLGRVSLCHFCLHFVPFSEIKYHKK